MGIAWLNPSCLAENYCEHDPIIPGAIILRNG
jgi:hypothetical protein